MSHQIGLGIFAACAVLSQAAAQQDFSKVQVKVSKVGGSVYMLEGIGREHRGIDWR